MNRKLISKAISDIDESFIAESMSPPVAKADHAPERTSNMGKYENKRNGVNSRKLISLILAACLIFTLAITAYALNLFGIREMFRSKNQDLPVEIDPYIQHHTETVAARDWGAQVTETFCDPTRVMVTVSVTGGDKYIVVPTDATPEHSVSVIGIDGDETLGEYAAAQGKELLCVSASLRQNEELGIFTEAMTFVNSSDSEMHILVDATRSNGNMTSNAACWVYAVNAAGERVDTLQIPIELAEAPATEAGNFVPDNPNAIPGLTVHSVSVEETPLGWTVRFISSITDDVAFENFKKMDCDELTDFDGGGFVLEDDGTWSTTWTMGKGNISDTLTVHFYDWDDQLIGDIVFKKN